MENYYDTLPEGYVPVKTIDATQNKTAFLLNLAALLIMLASITLLFFAKQEEILSLLDLFDEVELFSLIGSELIFLLLFFAGNALYAVLHELTHGAAYKLLTKQKLKFGFTGLVAFCGVPDGYVSKKTALISLLSPFLLFTAIFLPLALVFENGAVCLYFNLMFAAHFGGCAGDLYDTILLLFRFDNTVLLNDTGPAQTFYEKKK